MKHQEFPKAVWGNGVARMRRGVASGVATACIVLSAALATAQTSAAQSPAPMAPVPQPPPQAAPAGVTPPAGYVIGPDDVLAIVIWAATGPLFHFSDTWQLVINTSTTIVTFLVVFLIQNTQNRDSEAIQLKLDELIRATQGAHTALLDIEELSDKQLDEIREGYKAVAKKAMKDVREGKTDLGTPEVKSKVRDSTE